MNLSYDSQMQEAIARALRLRERMQNTVAAGCAAMDTAAAIMDLIAAAGLTLRKRQQPRADGISSTGQSITVDNGAMTLDRVARQPAAPRRAVDK